MSENERPSSVRAMLLRKREEGEVEAARWAASFIGECRVHCRHTAQEHADARVFLACWFEDLLAEVRELRAKASP